MNINEVEHEIIRSFVAKNRQERLSWELANPKKREKFFWNFAGTQYFKQDCLQSIELLSYKELETAIFRFGKTRTVYYLGASCIGRIPLTQAVQYAAQGDICIIYCGNGRGYYQGEPYSGNKNKYLLIAHPSTSTTLRNN